MNKMLVGGTEIALDEDSGEAVPSLSLPLVYLLMDLLQFGKVDMTKPGTSPKYWTGLVWKYKCTTLQEKTEQIICVEKT